jgi:RNA polymerase sigma-70 factor (ECF subfamily)
MIVTMTRGAVVVGKLPAAAGEQARAIIDGWLVGVESRWPDTRIDVDRVAAWIGERLDGVALDAMCGEDVVLACAAAGGDTAAIAAIDTIVRDAIERVVRDDDRRDELRQLVSAKLFVGAGKLAEYSGVGSLRRWVRMIVLRTHLDRERAAGRVPTVAVPDEQLAATPAALDDPELAYLKQHYRAEVRTAIGETVASLPAQSRILLRQHYLSRLTLDQLAELYEVHAVTISRWLATARDQLSNGMRAILARRLGVPRDELDSVLDLVRTNLDVSLSRLLDD